MGCLLKIALDHGGQRVPDAAELLAQFLAEYGAAILEPRSERSVWKIVSRTWVKHEGLNAALELSTLSARRAFFDLNGTQQKVLCCSMLNYQILIKRCKIRYPTNHALISL
jgi:hypothetical protein